jgi:hypothetical protein
MFTPSGRRFNEGPHWMPAEEGEIFDILDAIGRQ